MTEREKALKKLLLDESCFELLDSWITKVNLFDVLNNSRMEIRHSNVLSWLMTPTAKHGLKDGFLVAVVHELVRSEIVAEPDQIKLLCADWSDACIYREWFGLDILIVSKCLNYIVAIENKIDSQDHDKQLSRYKKSVDEAYPGYNRLFVYLTPEGVKPCEDDSDCWRPFSYSSISAALSSVKQTVGLDTHAKTIISNYHEIVRREIMEDEELKDICQTIYKEHAEALKLIFENVAIGGSPLREGMERILKELENKNMITLCVDKGRYTKPAFHTSEMDKYFGERRHSTEGGTWGNDYLYAFWFDRRYPERIDLRFEVAPYETNEEELKKINDLLDAMGCKRKTSQDVYARVWNYGKTLSVENESFSIDELSKWIGEAVEDALRRQKEWIAKVEVDKAK